MLESPPVLVDRITIRSLTLGVSLTDCTSRLPQTLSARAYDKIARVATGFTQIARELSSFYGIEVCEKRLSITPLSTLCDGYDASQLVSVTKTLDRAGADADLDSVDLAAVYQNLAWTAGARVMLQALPMVIGGSRRLRVAVVSWGDQPTCREGVTAIAKAIVDVGGFTDRNRSHDADRICAAHFPTRTGADGSSLYHPIGDRDITISVEISCDQVLDAYRSTGYNGREGRARRVRLHSSRLVRAGDFFATRLSDEIRERYGVAALPNRTRPCIDYRTAAGSHARIAHDQETESLPHVSAEIAHLVGAIDAGAKSVGADTGVAYPDAAVQPTPDPLRAVHYWRDTAIGASPFVIYPRIGVARTTNLEVVSGLLVQYLDVVGVKGPGGVIAIVPTGDS